MKVGHGAGALVELVPSWTVQVEHMDLGESSKQEVGRMMTR